MKNNLIPFVIFLVILTALILFESQDEKGFKANQGKNKTDIKVSFWHYWSGDEAKAIESLVNKFNAEHHGVKVEALNISAPRKKILMAISGKVPPDIVHLDDNMVGDFMTRSALLDLDAYTNTSFKEKFSSALVKTTSNKKGFFAVPILPSPEAMHYNKTLVAKNKLELPHSLEDFGLNFRSSSEQAFYLPSYPNWTGKFIVYPFGGSWGYFNEEGKFILTANCKQNIQAWSWVQENFIQPLKTKKIKELINKKYSYQSPENPFYAGKTLIANNGIWEYGFAEKFAQQKGYEFAVTVFPNIGPEQDPYSEVIFDALAIPRYAKQPQAAMKFIEWLSKQENLEALAMQQNKITALKKHSKNFLTKHPHKYIEVFAKLAKSKNLKTFPALKFANKYKRAIRLGFENILRKESDAQTELNKIQKEMEYYLYEDL